MVKANHTKQRKSGKALYKTRFSKEICIYYIKIDTKNAVVDDSAIAASLRNLHISELASYLKETDLEVSP